MAFFHTRSIMLLRLSLGVTFFWFGILKLFNASPVQPILIKAFPFLGDSQVFLFLYAFIEILLGIAFFANRFVKPAVMVMLISLSILTIAVMITQGFDPRFPILSFAGEDVLKNLVFIAAGLVLLSEKGGQESLSKKKGV